MGLLICIPPCESSELRYLMKPSILNLFIKKFTRGRVVPIIVASIPCGNTAKSVQLAPIPTPSNSCSLCFVKFPPTRRALFSDRNYESRFSARITGEKRDSVPSSISVAVAGSSHFY